MNSALVLLALLVGVPAPAGLLGVVVYLCLRDADGVVRM